MPAALGCSKALSEECKHGNLCHVLGTWGERLTVLHSAGSTRSSTMPHQWDNKAGDRQKGALEALHSLLGPVPLAFTAVALPRLKSIR